MGQYVGREVLGVVNVTQKMLFKNSLAYVWGFARLLPLVKYVVHIDDDVCLEPEPYSTSARWSSFSWLAASLGILRNNRYVISVHGAAGGAPCSTRHKRGKDFSCACKFLGKKPWEPLRPVLLNTEASVAVASTAASGNDMHEYWPLCGFLLQGENRVPHFSLQLLVVDMDRFARGWPLEHIVRYPHIEKVIEVGLNHFDSQFFPVFVAGSQLGVTKDHGCLR